MREGDMANIFDVAKYILKTKGKMSTLKLQKLCYYSQAWYLVWYDKPLFRAKIEAFAHGPVIRSLYDFHKGKFNLSAKDIPADKLSSELKECEKDAINKVLEFYADKSAQWLSDLSHSEAPWKDARKGIPDGAPSNREITLTSMMEYYSSL